MKCAKDAKGFGSISCLSHISVAIAFHTLTPDNAHGFWARFNLEAGTFAELVSHVPGTAHSF